MPTPNIYIYIYIYSLPAVWATEINCTVKQPIRAELNIINQDPSK